MSKSEPLTSPAPSTVWESLRAAVNDLRHPFRTPSLATTNLTRPAVRTVVLREADGIRGRLVCYSDRRAAKVADLLGTPCAEWLFYDPALQIQIRAAGPATVHVADEIARAAWKTTPLINRINYCAALSPGSTKPSREASLPPEWNDAPTLEQSEIGFADFAVIDVAIEKIDWLRLNPKGHRRVVLTRNDAGGWVSGEVAP